MTEERRQRRAREIVRATRTVPPSERDTHIERACGDDQELKRDVLELLRREESFLAAEGELERAPEPERSSVGPYRLLSTLGEGGMGVVYLAEQSEPVRRRVALKVIKLGMDTREVIARFEAERQALALMNHPAIASVYDAGATSDGRPYFAMEFVPGLPIDEFCDRHKLGIAERLELFVQVCHGIQHAHYRGVIHRDIKPTNILVSIPDQEPVAKIIDFGVARATNQRLTEKTIYTEIGRVIGTPQYMSPEQAEMTAEQIDQRSDVYSLGVLLYELLTGELPLDWGSLRRVAFDEVLRRIREEDPLVPSTRLTRLNTDRRAALATRRSLSPTAIVSELRGDLDWIAMKAIDKDRQRRYSTAAGLAEDIVAYLHGEPVLAASPSAVYQLKKYVRKHRVLLGATGAVVLALTIGLVVSILFAVEARRSERKAFEQGELAAKRLETVLRLSDVKRLADYTKEAEDLWPALPEKERAMEAWLAKAEELASHLDDHRRALSALRAQALPRRREATGSAAGDQGAAVGEEGARGASGEPRWEFADTELQWQHDTLSELIAGLETFTDPHPKKGTIASVKERLAFARTVYRRSIVDQESTWERAIRSIADREECPRYEGLRIVRQLGLVPLGPDPQSGLWEFAHLQTGDVPQRGADGRLILTDASGLVFVLIPGGSFRMGAATANLGGQLVVEDGQLRVEEILEGSLASMLGLATGDRILAVSGEKVQTPEDVESAILPLSTGDGVTVSILRGDDAMTLEAEVGPNVDPQARSNWGPVTRVTLAPFFLSKYEMTQGQWLRATGENPSFYGPEGEFFGSLPTLLDPVEQVSWEDCRHVLRQLDLLLPTEAQWEYACRAGTGTTWWTGSRRETLVGKANLADQSATRAGAGWQAAKEWPELDDGYAVHAPVGSYEPNPFGLHDTHGNVWEWCRDVYGHYGTPMDPDDGERQPVSSGDQPRVVGRGGSFFDDADHARSALRFVYVPWFRGFNTGVRPARRLLTE